MRLARKITILFLVPFLALLLLLRFRSTEREVGIYKTQVESDLLLTGRALRPMFAEVWRAEGEGRARAVIGEIDRGLPEIRLRWVPDGVRLDGREAAGGAIVRVEPDANGHGRLAVLLPLSESGAPPGGIELSQSLDRESSLIRDIIRDKLITTATAILVAIVIGGVVGTWFIGRPIRSLVEHARRVGRGDLSRDTPTRRNDELGELADELNIMCSDLESVQKRLATEAEARIVALEQLRHADRLATVGRLAAGLAHELGTPLNVVAGRAKMVAAKRLSPEETVEAGTTIAGQAARMTKIIRGLLDFARRGTKKKAPVDLSALAKGTIALLTPLSQKRGITMAVEGADDPCVLHVDAGQIEQVLTNLVVNAVDANGDGGAILIHLSEEDAAPPAGEKGARGRYVRLDVSDRGKGIAAGDLEHVFEPFFTTKDVGEGTGLGLSVAYGIVQDHGGWITVMSEPDQGSRFSVYLPKQ